MQPQMVKGFWHANQNHGDLLNELKLLWQSFSVATHLPFTFMNMAHSLLSPFTYVSSFIFGAMTRVSASDCSNPREAGVPHKSGLVLSYGVEVSWKMN